MYVVLACSDVGLRDYVYSEPFVRVDLNGECFSVFFYIFPKFRHFFLGKNHEIPEFRENTEKKLNNSPR